MKGTVECIKCHAQMESGWVPDNTDSGLKRQNWSPGEAQPNFWTGLKVERKDKVIPVTTFRCPNCGYLESYAIPETISDR
jgi:predicted nucleic-acid-binding Zn-ribbon protein